MTATVQIIAQRKQQVGPVAVTFTIGRIVPAPFASPRPAGDTGLSIGSPVNLPAADHFAGGGKPIAASDDQGGGLFKEGPA